MFGLSRKRSLGRNAFPTLVPTAPPSPPRRLVLVWLLLVIAGLALMARLVYLQVLVAAELTEKARMQQTRQYRTFVARRRIVDRHGSTLAIAVPKYTLYFYPTLLRKDRVTDKGRERPVTLEDIANWIGPVTGQNPKALVERLRGVTGRVTVAELLPETTAGQLRELRTQRQLSSIELEERAHRYYLQDDLLAQVLGYTDVSGRGQAGVELSYECLLNPVPDPKICPDTPRQVFPSVLINNQGKILPAYAPPGLLSVDNKRLVLTIDLRLQRLGRKVLREQMQRYNAKRGAVMVMETRTGELQALITEPSYNPNRFFEYAGRQELFKNWAVSDLYEPGSTFKPVNIAIALETGNIEPNTVIYDEGLITVSDRQIANVDFDQVGAPGSLNIAQVLARSSNVGMVHIMRRLSPAIFYGWLERMGVGEYSGIDLPAETSGMLKPQEEFVISRVEQAVTAFGQGFSLTPIQMLQLQGILASDGKVLVPHVVRALTDETGEEVFLPERLPPRQVLSPQTAVQVLTMMQAVVETGTGQSARIPGYRYGGKTGTAQKAEAGGYSDKKITSYVGIFPVPNPRYVVLAVIDEPIGDDAFGSTVAAPIVKALLEDIIVRDRIPPTFPEELTPKPEPAP
ncbi:MAG TPA: cell division protein FtsI [Cyanobacteria bacterium UBA8156]|jgi:cell division protein FtsI (penicillin-binding protein 3)|nr:cell division protein FtsI [Cyanobacteria bacterium UBA8156]